MRIGVISPNRQQGITTTSVLLSAAFAHVQNVTTVLIHAGLDDYTINNILGLYDEGDITKSFSQLIKLLEVNAIGKNDISDYCDNVFANFDVLHLSASEDSKQYIPFVTKSISHQVVIVDFDLEPGDEVTLELIEQMDMFVVVMSQSIDTLYKFDYWRECGYFDRLDKKGAVFLFNKYDPYVSAFRDLTKSVGLKHTRCCRLSYNPFIRQLYNMGELQNAIYHIVDKDIRFLELNNEVKEILHVVAGNLGMNVLWRGNL
jgi:hypothetical protein